MAHGRDLFSRSICRLRRTRWRTRTVGNQKGITYTRIVNGRIKRTEALRNRPEGSSRFHFIRYIAANTDMLSAQFGHPCRCAVGIDVEQRDAIPVPCKCLRGRSTYTIARTRDRNDWLLVCHIWDTSCHPKRYLPS
jgi:hypothetical protein